MKNKLFTIMVLSLTTSFLFLISELPANSYKKDSSGEDIYNMEKCGDCHRAPKELMEGIDIEKECDQCHNPVYGSVKVTATAAGEKNTKEEGPKDLDTLIHIPAGQFVQGSDLRHDDEGLEHKVYLDDYYIDKYEVTNIQYERFIKSTGYRKPIYWVTGKYPRGKAYHPVIYVDWFDAKAYCGWTGKRLPTESECEKAARGTDGRDFPWGNEFSEERGNVPDLGIGSLMPVGSFEGEKSPYGLYDMSGNVFGGVDF